MNSIHFIAGLPRSGSTLLRAILSQNPRVTTGISSPLYFLTSNLLDLLNTNNQVTCLMSDEQRKEILRGLVAGVYPHSDLIFDTNRLWPARIPLLRVLFPEAKLICCVRDPAWVIDSYERLFRKNPLRVASMFGQGGNANVYERAAAMMNPESGVIGKPLRALREAWEMEPESLTLVRYEDLASNPSSVLSSIYAAIEQPAFAHDFDNVTLECAGFEDYDDRFGMPGLHQIRRTVAFVEREPILPSDLVDEYSGLNFWEEPEFIASGV